WKATTSLDMKPEECLYVGDSYGTDILGAKKAGMQTCWFNPKNLPLPQEDVEPDFEIHTLDEILGILECV
ncbi:MAG: HAD family hydrolase, partial [Methanomicrobia archaeon]|nr:HAD family hydrolase [Methanomicrobia archaeon]